MEFYSQHFQEILTEKYLKKCLTGDGNTTYWWNYYTITGLFKGSTHLLLPKDLEGLSTHGSNNNLMIHSHSANLKEIQMTQEKQHRQDLFISLHCEWWLWQVKKMIAKIQIVYLWSSDHIKLWNLRGFNPLGHTDFDVWIESRRSKNFSI